MPPPHAQERNRKACDKCHQQKLSCKKMGGGDECERCHRLKRPCTSSPPLRNQRSSTTTRRNPREHDGGGGRRRPKTLAILPRSSPPSAATPVAVPLASSAYNNSNHYSASDSGSSSYSQDQDTTAPAIPAMSEPLATDTMGDHQQHQQQQYMDTMCWAGHAVTAAEISGAWGLYRRVVVTSSRHGRLGGMWIFPFQRDPGARNENNVPLRPGAHVMQLPPRVVAAPPITSADTRDPAIIRGDLDSSYAAAAGFPHVMGFGPGFVQYAGYRPGGRVRFDWQPLVCADPSFQGEMHSMLET
ncbi:uncharacterized protein PG998_015035 [Apiospora kogelbergensis]|uniref:uncharacterized protein n=1 Tax=Apiospora kogelbergensis TaxID=1337665 RepID=UPI00312F5D5B